MQRLNDTLSALPFISQELVETLDWAWLVDFGQGDFEQAKTETELALLGEWNGTNLLARGIVHQLQGEYARALSLLKQALSIESESSNKLIIATIAYLTERKARDNLADGFSLMANKSNTDLQWQKKTKDLKQEVRNLECCLEISLLQQIATILPCWRTTIAKQSNEDSQQHYRELILEQLTKQLELYQGQSYHAIAEFFYCCFAELLALSGQFTTGWQLLEELTPAYFNSAKYLETAWYLLSQGDLILETAPLGKPIVLGYRLLENQYDCALIQCWDRSAIDTATAQQQYVTAREHFKTASAARGEATAIARLAYINGIQKQWHLAACGYEEARRKFLDTGDRINAIAAEMGYLWSSLYCQELAGELLEKIEESAVWMLDNDTTTFALSWLLVFIAAAHEALPQEEGLAISRRLIKVAETIATRAINLETVFAAEVTHQLWQRCHREIGNFYRCQASEFAKENNWQQILIAAEKSKIYAMHAEIQTVSQGKTLTLNLNSIVSEAKIAAIIPIHTILLSFIVTPHKLLSWAITNKGLIKTHIVDTFIEEPFEAEKLEQTLNTWLSDGTESSAKTESDKTLEKVLLSPFASEITANKHLVITVCDRLEGLSFAALKYHHPTSSNILKKEKIIGVDKTISYLFYPSQITRCELVATAMKGASIFTEDVRVVNNRELQNSATKSFSLSHALAIAIARLYDIQPFHNLSSVSPEIREAIKFKPIINLFLSEKTSFFEQLTQHEIASELVILNIRERKIKQIPSKQLMKLSQNILNAGAKTVVTIFDGEDSLASAILTSFFHQGLYFGQTVTEALRQAQKQLRLVTAQEAIDFCQYLQSHIAWQTKCDRALRALLVKYTGDVMVLGKDYRRAAEAYGVAIKILESVGYSIEAKALQHNYKMFKSMRNMTQTFQAECLIFDVPGYWNNAYIHGDWQLSFVEM